MASVLMMLASEGGAGAKVKHTAVSAEAFHACGVITHGTEAPGEHRSGSLMPPTGGYRAMPRTFGEVSSNCPSGCGREIDRLHR